MTVRRLLNGTEVHAIEGFRTWVRAYELVRALGLNLSKQQIDAKLENTAQAGLIDWTTKGKKHWFVTWPKGVRMLANKCRPYTVEGIKFKADLLGKKGLALVVPVKEMLDGTRPATWPAPGPRPVVEDTKKVPADPSGRGPNGRPGRAHPVAFAEQPREASTVIAALQNQLTLAGQNAARQEVRIRELTEQLQSQVPPEPEVAVPARTLRATIRRHIASYATKMIAHQGWLRTSPEVRHWYHGLWASLYSEFADRYGVNFRTRYHNLTEDERRELGVSSAVDLMKLWVVGAASDGSPLPMSKGHAWREAPPEYQGLLPKFYALVHEMCPVNRYMPWEQMPDGVRYTFYDGAPGAASAPARSSNGQGKACQAQVF